jgi:hypothetical protein
VKVSIDITVQTHDSFDFLRDRSFLLLAMRLAISIYLSASLRLILHVLHLLHLHEHRLVHALHGHHLLHLLLHLQLLHVVHLSHGQVEQLRDFRGHLIHVSHLGLSVSSPVYMSNLPKLPSPAPCPVDT